MTFFAELKRRNVFRVAIAYVLLGWVVLQGADFLLDLVGAPDWVIRAFAIAGLVGFPFVLVFAWVYELTPEGIKRDRDVDRSASIAPHTGHRMNAVIVTLAVLAIALLALDRLWPEPESPSPSVAVEPPPVEAAPGSEADAEDATADNSIAVLPFVNMSGDPDNEYFSDGLTEELLNTLVRIGGLKVTGRTSSFAFKGQNLDLRDVGRQLNVANVLEGSVRKAGNRVRITAQLVKTDDGYHLWSDTFDRELTDIFAVQEEIAEQVTGALEIALLGDSVRPAGAGPVAQRDPVAYEEYLRGLYVWQHEPDELASLQRAEAHFQRALEIDAEYPEALWGMFLIWDRKNRNGHGPFRESLDRMLHLAAELERLAPGSDRALGAAARVAVVDRRYRESLDTLAEAVRRYPASANLWAEYASSLLTIPDNAAALDAIRRAAELDPLSLNILRWQSYTYYRLGDCTGTGRSMERALELQPEVGRFRYYHAMCLYETTGDAGRALPLAEAEPLGFTHDTALAILYHALGREVEARERLDAMHVQYGDSASYQYAQVAAQWGDVDTAISWLRNALEIRDPGILQSNGDRLLAPLQDEPRFQKILHDAGF